MTLFCTRWLPWPSSWCVVRLNISPTVPHLGSPHCGLRDCVWVASPASAVTSGVWCSLMACLFCSSESTMPSSAEGGAGLYSCSCSSGLDCCCLFYGARCRLPVACSVGWMKSQRLLVALVRGVPCHFLSRRSQRRRMSAVALCGIG